MRNIFTRKEIIEKLINDDIDTIVNQYEVCYLSSVLAKGFRGYKNFTNEELEQESSERLNPEYGKISVVE